MQQIERDCFSVAKRRSIYIYDVSISGFTRSSIYIYDISSLRVNVAHAFAFFFVPSVNLARLEEITTDILRISYVLGYDTV